MSDDADDDTDADADADPGDRAAEGRSTGATGSGAGTDGRAADRGESGLPAPFDETTVAAVADEHGVAVATLCDLVAAHQASLTRHASATGWVYEVRRAYPRDALVERRPEAFYLAVEPTVWPEFERVLDGSDDELAALRALHDRVLRAAVDPPDDDRDPMVVVRR